MKNIPRFVWAAVACWLGVLFAWGWGDELVQAGSWSVCPSGCDFATIQAAVDAAAPHSTLLILPATYTETVIITKSLTLTGVGQPQPVVSGNDSGRPFTILGSVAVTMSNLTVTRGRAPVDANGVARGGGIYNQGQLTLDHVTISHNQAIGRDGQASHEAGGLAYGGGLFSECNPANLLCFDIHLTAVTVISNTAMGGKGGVEGLGGNAYGGGVAHYCLGDAGVPCNDLVIVDSNFGFNRAWGGQAGDAAHPSSNGSRGGEAFGGGITNACIGVYCTAIEITRSEVHHNQARGGDSSALSNLPTPFLANGFGGGIYTQQRPLIKSSHVHHNQAYAGAYSPGGIVPFPDSIGGGIYMKTISGATRPGGISHSTINNNQADSGGGILIAMADLPISNSTISHNVVRLCGGGILHEAFEDSPLDYVTITENVVFTPPTTPNTSSVYCYWSNGGSGIYRVDVTQNTSISIRNSIVANNWGVGDPTPDCYGLIVSRGFNFIPNCPGYGNSTGNITGQPITLGPLQDNGGLTPTHALLPGTVAIDAAAPADCPDTDQRQFARWVDGNADGHERCDMGAYEYGGMPTDVGLVGQVRGRDASSMFIWLMVGVLSIAALLAWPRYRIRQS